MSPATDHHCSGLTDLVAIVHIPVSHLPNYETRLYWTVLHASRHSDEFFNVTSNRIEIAVFASLALVENQWREECAFGDRQGVRVSRSWRVFEVGSGDVGDAPNFGTSVYKDSLCNHGTSSCSDYSMALYRALTL